MERDYSEFLIILDRSGSMQVAADDHEGGLNSFIKDQQRLEGDVRITLIQFDDTDPCEVVMDGIPAEKAEKVRLIPRGGTPLLDAVGKGVAHFSKRLESLEKKPDIIVVMIITDGQENQSREWTKARIKSLVEQKEKEGWKFLFLGANMDAFHEAGAYGLANQGTMTFANNQSGTQGLYASVTSGALCARTVTQQLKLKGPTGPMGTLGPAGIQSEAYKNFDWTDEQKLAAVGQGSCTCIGTPDGDENCPIHANEVKLKRSLLTK